MGNIVVSNSTLLLSGTNTVNQSVSVISNGVISHPAQTSNTVLNVTGNITIDTTSQVNVSGKGFTNSTGPGAGVTGSTGGGGGYGGSGGSSSFGAAGGQSYGSISQPISLGSGGGGGGCSQPGGTGGGAIELNVLGTMQINGIMAANGTTGGDMGTSCRGGGGSGGSIYLNVGSLSGNGSISANGGSPVASFAAGGGAGGRIAIYYAANSYIGTISVSGAVGNVDGGAGTIYTQESNAAGTITVNGGNVGVGATTTLSASSVSGSPNVTVLGGGTALLSGGVTVGDITVSGANSLLLLSGTNTVNQDVSLTSNGVISHPAQMSNAVLNVAGNFTVDAASQVNVSGKGFTNSAGPGAGTAGTTGGGGGYGGNGGAGSSGAAGGQSYGSISQPISMGSGGGGGCQPGGAGGGAIELNVLGMMQINGIMAANGATGGDSGPSCRGGGGSGGSIYLNVGMLSGSGSISANGGSPVASAAGGGGAGGRIAIYTDTNMFAGAYSFVGGIGSQNGQSGTVYTKPIDNQLLFGQPIYGRIDSPNLVDQWLFSATDGQQIRLQQIGYSTPGLVFDLSGPDGWSGFFGITNESTLITLTNAGEYSLTVRATNFGYHGEYTFVLEETTETNVALDASYVGNFVGNGQAQIIAVNVTNRGPLLITLNNSGANNLTGLYAQLGSPPTPGSYGWSSVNLNSPNQQILIANALPGIYYILAYGNQISTASSYTVETQTSSVLLAGVTPYVAAGNMTVNLTLSGAGFLPSSIVQLISSNGTAFPALSVNVDSFTQISASFASNSLPNGSYSIQVLLPGGATTTLANSLQVVTGVPNFTDNLTVPSESWESTPSTIYAQYANTGTASMLSPLMVLTVQQNGNQDALLGLDPSLLVQGEWTLAQRPTGFNNSAQFLASGQTPGSLQPSESLTTPIYWAGWNGSLIPHQNVNWNLGFITGDNPNPLNWASLQSSLQPPNVPADAWSAIFSVFTNETGSTLGSYVTMLDNNAAYLGKLGLNVTDASKLVAFQLMKADGLCPLPTLASSVDASVPAPGLPLVFSRSFGGKISQRYALGPLGRGWSHNWQLRLQTNVGTVTVIGPGGAQRLFQQNKQGGYFNRAGDYGTLAAVAGGAYTLTETTGLLYYYQADGTLGYVQDLNNNRITCHYTGGLLTNLTHSSGQSLTLSYSGALIQSITDSASRTTTFIYDDAQHLQTASYFNGTQVLYTYSGVADGTPQAHTLTQIALADGTHEFLSCDTNGRIASITRDGGAEAITFTYAGQGLTQIADAFGNTSSYFFDNRGLLAKTQNPMTNLALFSYDNNFNLTDFTDSTGGIYNYFFDNNGNQTQSVNALGQTANFAYQQPFNLVASLGDPNTHTTTYAHFSDGNLRSITDANNTVEQWNYDSAGNPITWTNRRGQVISCGFNADGQPSRKTYPDGHTINYYYNAHNLPTNITDSILGVTLMNYDSRDLLTNLMYPNGNGFAFVYDKVGRRTSRIGNDGYTLEYSYDGVGRLAALSNNINELLIQYNYDAAGRLAQETKGNGTITTYAYDGAGRTEAMTNFAPDATVQSFFNYTYDANGNVVSMADANGTTIYSYDALNQLNAAIYPSGRNVRYNYDAVGNRTEITDSGTNIGYTVNSVNEYTYVGTATILYDADGNLTNSTGATGTTNYQYDFENRLVSVSTPTNGKWQYIYDALGNRTAIVQNGLTNSFLIDPSGLGTEAVEYNSSGALLARYDTGLGLVSRIDASGNATFYGFDASGDTRQLTGDNAALLNAYDYDAFGESTVVNETVPNLFRFGGRLGVSEELNGLHFMRARFYMASFGRFTSKDPLGLGGRDINLYRYSGNAPVTRGDSSGLQMEILNPYFGFAQYGELSDFVRYQLWRYSPEISKVTYAVGDLARFAVNSLGHLPGGKGLAALPELPYLSPSFLLPIEGFGISFADGVGWVWIGYDIADTLDLAPVINGAIYDSWYQYFLSQNQWPVLPTRSGTSAVSVARTPGDPNELTGPAGFGMQAYATESNLFNYAIYFENETNATANAQGVQITDPLPAMLDWQTFQLGEIAFGNVFIPIPPNVQYFQTNVPLSSNGVSYEVFVDAGIDLSTGEVFANFFSINPATGLPPANGIGFLPPDDVSGDGRGHIA